MHDIAYKNNKSYKKYSDSPVSKQIHRATFAAFTISFVVLTLAQIGLPNIFNFGAPNKALASTKTKTWTTTADFSNGQNPNITNSNVTLAGVGDLGNVQLTSSFDLGDGSDGDLVVDGDSGTAIITNSPNYPSGITVTRAAINSMATALVLDQEITVNKRIWNFKSVTLRDGAMVTHSVMSAALSTPGVNDVEGIEIKATGSVDIQLGSAIDVTAKSTKTTGTQVDSGGGYGGLGGAIPTSNLKGPTYGTSAVEFMGSKGADGTNGGVGGYGGGRIKLSASQILVSGKVESNGGGGASTVPAGLKSAGGGSGGGIIVASPNLTISGVVSAAGGGGGGIGGTSRPGQPGASGVGGAGGANTSNLFCAGGSMGLAGNGADAVLAGCGVGGYSAGASGYSTTSSSYGGPGGGSGRVAIRYSSINGGAHIFPTTTEESNSSIVKSGSWSNYNDFALTTNTAYQANTSISYSFSNKTKASWIGSKFIDGGKADVVLSSGSDTISTVTVDTFTNNSYLYCPGGDEPTCDYDETWETVYSPLHNQELFTAQDLDTTKTYTLTITQRSDKNTSSSGYRITLDKFSFLGHDDGVTNDYPTNNKIGPYGYFKKLVSYSTVGNLGDSGVGLRFSNAPSKTKWNAINFYGEVPVGTTVKYKVRAGETLGVNDAQGTNGFVNPINYTQSNIWSSSVPAGDYTQSYYSLNIDTAMPLTKTLEIIVEITGGMATPRIDAIQLDYDSLDAPSNIMQYRSDNVEITNSAWTNEGVVKLKADVSDMTPIPATGETLTPEIEIVTGATPVFTGTKTAFPVDGVNFAPSEHNYAGPATSVDFGTLSGFTPSTIYHWKMRFIDQAGRVGPWSGAKTFGVDQVAPAGTLTINSNANFTTSTEVNLSISATDGGGSEGIGIPSLMRLSNNGTDWGTRTNTDGTIDPTFSDWRPYETSITGWDLPAGDGEKKVFIQFKDNAGNVSGKVFTSQADWQAGTLNNLTATKTPGALTRIDQSSGYQNAEIGFWWTGDVHARKNNNTYYRLLSSSVDENAHLELYRVVNGSQTLLWSGSILYDLHNFGEDFKLQIIDSTIKVFKGNDLVGWYALVTITDSNISQAGSWETVSGPQTIFTTFSPAINSPSFGTLGETGTSLSIDSGVGKVQKWKTLNWTASLMTHSSDAIKFQISTDGSNWIGPNGATGDWSTNYFGQIFGGAAISDIPVSFPDSRYLYVKIKIESTENVAPTLYDLAVQSAMLDSITLDTQPPAQPSGLKAYADNTKQTEYNQTNWYTDNNIYVEWTDDAEVSDYKYCIDTANTCTPNTSLGGNSYFNANLSALSDGTKKIRVSGTDAASNVSTVASFTYNMDANVPGAVTGLTASNNDLARINLFWNSANTGSPLDHYILERVKYTSFESNFWDNADDWSTGDGYATFSLTSTSFIDDSSAAAQGQTPIEQSVSYAYKIKVKDTANAQYSPYQTSVITGLTRDGLPPTSPTEVEAIACDGTLTNCSDVANKGFEIKLTWAPSTDTGTGVAKYSIYRAKVSPDDPASYTKIGEATNPIFYDNDALHVDSENRLNDYSTYYYRVTATDNATPTDNESGILPAFDPTLNLDSATTPDVTAPSIPTDLTATPLGIDASGEAQKVQITWSASVDTKARSANNGSGVSEYHLYKATAESGPYSHLATISANTLEYSEEGLLDFTYYYYKVAAVDNSNNPSDPTTRQSDLTSVRTASSAVPTVPTNVSVVSKKGNPESDAEIGRVIDVTFKGSYAKYYKVTKYELYRSTTNYASSADWLDPTKAIKVREYDITPIQDDRDTLYAHKDTNLTDATTYYYKVRALDTTPIDPDGGPFWSGLSMVTVNTPGVGWDMTPDVSKPSASSSILEVNVKDTHPNEFELRNILTWKMLSNGNIPKRKKQAYENCTVIATVDNVDYCSDFAKYEVHRETIDPNTNEILSDVIVAEKTTLNDNYFIDIVQIAFKDSKFKYYVQVVDNAGSDFRFSNGNLVNSGYSNRSAKVYWSESIIPSKSKPTLIGSVSLSNIGVASAEISWTTDQEADSLVQFRPKGTSEDWITVGQIEREASHNVRIFGLKPLTEYEYQIVSRNYLGNNVENYGTLPALKTTGFNITMGNVTTTTTGAEINWRTNLDADSAFVEYELQRQGNDEPQGKTVGVNPEDLKNSPKSHRVVIQGLKSNRTYTYKIKSISKDGYIAEHPTMAKDNKVSESFATRSFDSGQFTLAPSSSNVAERNITATTAQIIWQTAMPATSWVDYSTKSGVYDMSSGNDTLSQQHVVVIEGLIPGTTYYYRVRAKDGNDIEYTSQEYSFRAVLKPKIEDLKVSDVTPYGFTLEWNTNVDTDTLIALGTSQAYGEKRGIPGLRKQHKVVVDGLIDNTEYHYQILAKDELGNEVADSDKIVRTPLDTEGPQILNVKTDVLPIGADEAGASVIISWQTNKPSTTMVEYDEGIIGGRYSNKSIEDKTLNLSHSVILKDLKPASSYHFKIVSKDKRGNLGQSPDHTFVTPTKEKSILQLILRSLEETFSWTRNLGSFFSNIGGRAKGR